MITSKTPTKLRFASIARYVMAAVVLSATPALASDTSPRAECGRSGAVCKQVGAADDALKPPAAGMSDPNARPVISLRKLDLSTLPSAAFGDLETEIRITSSAETSRKR